MYTELLQKLRRFLSFSLKDQFLILFPHVILIALLPRTIRRMGLLLRPLWTGEWKEVAGFTKETAAVFPWYLRIAECVGRYGRYGYVYEDGLGFSLKERFWLNPAALAIYHALKIHLFAFLSALLFVSGLFAAGLWMHVPMVHIGIALLFMVGSPLFLISFFHYAKPEILSWAFFPLMLIAFLQGSYVLAALLLIVLAILNFTTSLLALESMLLYALISSHLFQGILVALPALLILLLDFIPLARWSIISGLIEVIGGGKAASRSDHFLQLHLEDAYLLFLYGLFVAGTLTQRLSPVEIALLLNAPLLFFFNQKLFRFADHHTFFRFFLAVSSVILLLHPSLTMFAFSLLLFYVSPAALLGMRERSIKEYPGLHPYSLKNPDAFFEKRFAPIQKGQRIAFEREDAEKSMEGFKNIFYYFEYLLFKRSIEFLPMEWLRLTQTDYFTKEYVKINWKSDRSTVEEKCKELGARYVMAHSDRFCEALREWGWREVTAIRAQDLKNNLWNIMGLPEENLVVFEVPFSVSFISPAVPMKRFPNTMEFEAKQGVSYIIRCTFSPSWRAYQDGEKVPIFKESGSLSFLSVKAKQDGPITLCFSRSMWS